MNIIVKSTGQVHKVQLERWQTECGIKIDRLAPPETTKPLTCKHCILLAEKRKK